MCVETHKQLRKDLTNSLRFILSTTFQINMDMENGHQIKIRFPPLEVMKYRFSKEDVMEYFIGAIKPTNKEITEEDVAGVVMEHLNEQMHRLLQ